MDGPQVRLSEGAALPVAGIRLAVAAAGIRYKGRDDVCLIELPRGASTAAVFTRNRFCAAPVVVAREHLAKDPVRYLLINSGNANAGTGDEGLRAARETCRAVGAMVACPMSQILPFSTGVIGEDLPIVAFQRAMPDLAASLQEDAWPLAARAIMTTDTRPKQCSCTLELSAGQVTLTGIAKGSGMIRPDMATMLAFIATDAQVPQPLLQTILERAVQPSFNSITVDGDAVERGLHRPLQYRLQQRLWHLCIGRDERQHGRHIGPDHPGTLGDPGQRHLPRRQLQRAAALLGAGIGGHDRPCGERPGILLQRGGQVRHRALEGHDRQILADHTGGEGQNLAHRAGHHGADRAAGLARRPQPLVAGARICVARVDQQITHGILGQMLARHHHRRCAEAVAREHRRRGCAAGQLDQAHIVPPLVADARRRDGQANTRHRQCGAFAQADLRPIHQLSLPWQCLYFLPEPQGQGSLRPTLRSARTKGCCGSAAMASSSSTTASPPRPVNSSC